MISIAHHSMLKCHTPTVFNYLAVKVIAPRVNQGSSAGWSYMTTNSFYTSIGTVQFIDSSDAVYSMPSTTTVTIYGELGGIKHVNESAVLTNSPYKNLFSSTTPSSSSNSFGGMYLATSVGFSSGANGTSVFYYESGETMLDKTKTYSSTDYQDLFRGDSSSAMPNAVVLNVSQSPLDISTYSRWRFYNGYDQYGASRFWCEGEVLGSVDGTTWYRLDRFNDTTLGGKTNYSLARTAELIPTQGGDLFQDLDYMKRDWLNGIKI